MSEVKTNLSRLQKTGLEIGWLIFEQTNFNVDELIGANALPLHTPWLSPPEGVNSVYGHIGTILGAKNKTVQKQIWRLAAQPYGYFEASMAYDEASLTMRSKVRVEGPLISLAVDELSSERASDNYQQAELVAEQAEACVNLARFHGRSEPDSLFSYPNFYELEPAQLVVESARITNLLRDLSQGTGLRTA